MVGSRGSGHRGGEGWGSLASYRLRGHSVRKQGSPPAAQHFQAEPKYQDLGPPRSMTELPASAVPTGTPLGQLSHPGGVTRPPPSPRARTHLDSSPVASTPKCSHTAGQNCSRHVMKSSSRLARGGNEPGPGSPGPTQLESCSGV